MDATVPFTPHAWESFYVIVGSSAGALTGLQFVVLALITEAGMIRGTGETLAGLAGFVYSVGVPRRAMRQRDYKPVLEDWIWHALLPLLAYAAMMYAGIQLARVSADALFIVGGSTLLLVFIGIHNAWDTVTYVTLERARGRKSKPPTKPSTH